MRSYQLVETMLDSHGDSNFSNQVTDVWSPSRNLHHAQTMLDKYKSDLEHQRVTAKDVYMIGPIKHGTSFEYTCTTFGKCRVHIEVRES